MSDQIASFLVSMIFCSEVSTIQGWGGLVIKERSGVVEHIWTKDYQRSTKNVISAWGTRSQAKRCCSNIFVYYPYTIHVWHIYLGLVDFEGKCRWIYHTQIRCGLFQLGQSPFHMIHVMHYFKKGKDHFLAFNHEKSAFLTTQFVFSVWCHKFTLWDSSQKGYWSALYIAILLMVQKSKQPPGMVLKPLVKDGINYQPQLVNAGFLNHQQ